MNRKVKAAVLGLPTIVGVAFQASPAFAEDLDPVDESEGVTPETIPSSDDPQAGISCGRTGVLAYKYSTKVAIWTVDVFRHNSRIYVCEDNTNITDTYKDYNLCERIGPHGMTYTTNTDDWGGGHGTKEAWHRANCAVTAGATIEGIGLSYTKQSNTKVNFGMSNGGAYYNVEHYTTTP